MKKCLLMGLLILSSVVLFGCSVVDTVIEKGNENNRKMDEVILEMDNKEE